MLFLVFFSFSAASQWSHRASLPPTIEYDQMRFVSPTTGWVVGPEGTIRKSTNGGAYWFAQESGTTSRLLAPFAIDSSRVWVVGVDGVIVHTTNGGETWLPQSSGVSNHLLSVWFADQNHGWASGDGGTLVRTSNGGAQWDSVYVGTTTRLTSVSFSDSLHGLAVGDEGIIFRTVNGGVTWQAESSGVSTTLWQVEYLDTMNAWIVGGHWDDGSSAVLKTTNGGVTWIPVEAASIPFFCMDFLNDQTGWIAGRSGTILHTTNGGNSWQDESNDGYWFHTISVVDEDHAWILEPGGTLLWRGLDSATIHVTVSTDKVSYTPGDTIGITITATNRDTVEVTLSFPSGEESSYTLDSFDLRPHLVPSSPTSVTIAAKGSHSWFWRCPDEVSGNILPSVGMHTVIGEVIGVGFSNPLTIYVYPVLSVPSDPGQPLVSGLEQNYPNPFNPTTTIPFTMDAAGRIRLSVFDVLGREVRVLANGVFSRGRHLVQADLSGLSSGTYICRLKGEYQSYSTIMILAK